ncbi:MAG: class II fructose-bisphosphate aldolase [Dorea sp.]
MHGGSGVSKEDFHKAIKAGVRKINYFTYMDKAGGTATEEYVESVEKGETGILFISQSSRFRSNERKCKRGNKDIFYDRLRVYNYDPLKLTDKQKKIEG